MFSKKASKFDKKPVKKGKPEKPQEYGSSRHNNELSGNQSSDEQKSVPDLICKVRKFFKLF